MGFVVGNFYTRQTVALSILFALQSGGIVCVYERDLVGNGGTKQMILNQICPRLL